MTHVSKLTITNLALTLFLSGIFFDQQRWGFLFLELAVLALLGVSIGMSRRDEVESVDAR